jgi:hypothetical protein
MKTKTLLLVAALAMVLACGRNSEQSYDQGYTAAEAPAYDAKVATLEEAPPPPTERTEVVEQKLIKRGYLAFEVEDLAQTHQKIIGEAKKLGGYIASDSEFKEYDRVAHSMSIRVPAAQFDAFVTTLAAGVAHFDEKQITVDDVTEQFVDLQARLKTKKELEARYLELLRQAKNVKDMLEIERELGTLRADIESMEGVFRVLKNQVAYATIDVRYYILQVESERGFGHKFSQAFRGGWENFIGFFVGLAYIWPFVIVIGVAVYYFIRRIKRKRQAK